MASGRLGLRETRSAHLHPCESQQQSGETPSLHTYACPLPGPNLVAVYGALALHRHPVPAVTSLGS